ncbi:hypothetical protein TWF718_009029 [Orbilia javanica]|uniref:Uncharacterized protein n=1 Tax=Orbilia javanica TaxID=47235 RepID=A0AAN8MV89_9PEZI
MSADDKAFESEKAPPEYETISFNDVERTGSNTTNTADCGRPTSTRPKFTLRSYQIAQRVLRYGYILSLISYIICLGLYITVVVDKLVKGQFTAEEPEKFELYDAFAIGVLIFPGLCAAISLRRSRNIKIANEIRQRQLDNGEVVWRALTSTRSNLVLFDEVDTDISLCMVSIVLFLLGFGVVFFFEELRDVKPGSLSV